jgi:1,4-alpha-glucan branching enzyme
MPSVPIRFTYVTGIAAEIFTAARLKGSWDRAGRHSDDWSLTPMDKITGPDGCPAFSATIQFDRGAIDRTFHWGVELDSPAGNGRWGIMTEESRLDSTRRIRALTLTAPPSHAIQEEVYYLSQSRRLGAQRYHGTANDGAATPIRFSVWAPNATAVDVCIGTLWRGDDPERRLLIDPAAAGPGQRALRSAPRELICGGYIADNGEGCHPTWGPFPLTKESGGVWVTDVNDPALADFRLFDHVPYMFRVKKDDGTTVYRTDLYSRCQIGYGSAHPRGAPYRRPTVELDGTVSCSVVVNPDLVTTHFLEPLWPEADWTEQTAFFAAAPRDPRLDTRDLQDLVIYELHVGALGAPTRGAEEPGTLKDAIELLDYLVDLGVNAVELLPMSESGGGGGGWGYATSHYLAIEYAGGGRDQYKCFVRECHKRGIAVILDVVYNHYNHNAERAEWMYDTGGHETNTYYWYEGRSSDYAIPEGGYVDNVSTAWAPRYHEELVRAMFVSSAVALATEFQVDGFRMDQTTSIHAYNVLHADGRPLPNVNAFGVKLLRELTRSLKFVAPGVMLMAEDHSNWDGVTAPPDEGGLGFDATWYADFYHHLIGDTDKGSDYAKLLKTAGLGDDRPLLMSYFAGALHASGGRRVVYHESHDEAGNGEFTDRTINVAVNGAPLLYETRTYAEARCRFAAGVTILSAGTPMFLFGEEVGAQNKFLYGKVLRHREDLKVLREGSGRQLFEFYRAIIRLRRDHPGLRSRNIDVVFTRDEDRLIVFRRWGGGEDFLVVASLNNHRFDNPGYTFPADRIPSGQWREIFNSDSGMFGGGDVGNGGRTLSAAGGTFDCVVPANGLVVFERVSQ